VILVSSAVMFSKLSLPFGSGRMHNRAFFASGDMDNTSSAHVSGQQRSQQSSETMEVSVQHDAHSLSMTYALEDPDHMTLSGDFLELPKFEPTLIPTLRFDPEDEKG